MHAVLGLPGLLVPALILTLACGGASRLNRREAESDIRKNYPVTVSLRVKAQDSAIKGSPDHAKLVKFQEALTKPGWFTVERREEGDREAFSFKPTPQAPKELRPAALGWELPAAQAEFVKATRLEEVPGGARVAYQVRLTRPTPHFSVFQAIHGAKIGDAKERHAAYRREGRDWVLQDTDESFKK